MRSSSRRMAAERVAFGMPVCSAQRVNSPARQPARRLSSHPVDPWPDCLDKRNSDSIITLFIQFKRNNTVIRSARIEPVSATLTGVIP